MTITYILLTMAAGVAAGWAMHGLMLAISSRQEVPVNMVRALGSFGSGEVNERATWIGFAAHTAGGAVLGLIYGLLLHFLGIQSHPVAFLAGGILGFFHGLVVAYILMYYAAERHPVADYRKATMPVGATHLCGHIFFGLTVVAIVFFSTAGNTIGDGDGTDSVPRELQLDENPP